MVKKILTVGKRKRSNVRLNIENGSGKFYINNRSAQTYVQDEILYLKLIEPLIISDMKEKFDISIKVFGGGVSSQIDAMRQALARAIIETTKDSKLKKLFQLYDKTLLVSDTRRKEAYKPNNSKARAKRQKSYR